MDVQECGGGCGAHGINSSHLSITISLIEAALPEAEDYNRLLRLPSAHPLILLLCLQLHFFSVSQHLSLSLPSLLCMFFFSFLFFLINSYCFCSVSWKTCLRKKKSSLSSCVWQFLSQFFVHRQNGYLLLFCHIYKPLIPLGGVSAQPLTTVALIG